MVKKPAGSSAGPNENMMVSKELKSYLNEHFHILADKKDITEMKQEIMALVTSMMAKITSLETNINVLESKKAILESHIAHLKSNQESHEQYSRRLCLRIDSIGFPEDSNQETSEDILQKVKHVVTENGVGISVIDRAHRIGQKSSRDGKAKQQVIVR